ncbi:retrovirus-related pol polyprotein from transposon TNT 1-94 [Tanacetum coccineum]|uniref:Retrovirus-related pol polyprotein from transposon TNT 1-94 n=1 Tax=Tanacetum coccineum TaxID=301880 RepID=A0ABQ4Y4G4_9ASTR
MSVKYPTYVNLTSSSEEQPNERTSSHPPIKKSLSPPQAPSKSISSKSIHYTSSSSLSESSTPTHVAPPPKLHFVIPIKQEPQELSPLQMSPNKPHVSTMDNWPPGPSNPSPPPRVSQPPLEFPNLPLGFEPLPSTQPLFVNINNNTPHLLNNAPPLENIYHPPPNLGNQDFLNPPNILDFVHPNDMPHLHNMFCQFEESLNVTFDESPLPPKTSPLEEDDLVEEKAIKVSEKKLVGNDVEDEVLENDEIINIKESKNHPLENFIGNLNQRTHRSQAHDKSNFFCFLSTIEPKNVGDSLKDKSWVVAMQEELNKFTANDVWELVPNPKSMTVIGTKWVFRNKLDENGVVSRNKARLVAQGYNQQEGIDYDKTYAHVARLESIRILLAYACALDFKLFQMNVKSAFLNGFINEEVYVEQAPGFIDFAKLNHVYKLKKALCGVKKDPKAWYDILKAFLFKHDYHMGMVDNTLFTKKKSSNLIIVQIYVDDIIFGSTSQELCDDFAKIMHDEFEMSMMGELNFFLGLEIKQLEDGIFFNQSKNIKEMLKKFGFEDSNPMKTPMSSDTKLTKDKEGESVDNTKYRGTTHLGLWYPKRSGIETVVYVDSDNVGDYVDRKSTSAICTFMGCCLTSWFLNKQNALAISTTEAEYVSAGKACQQALWMKQALIDYDIRVDDIPIMCDNKRAIDLSKNPVQHSRKHIKIRHHFLRDNVQKGNISIEKVPSKDNIADVLTKPLKCKPFNYLHLVLGMIEQID